MKGQNWLLLLKEQVQMGELHDSKWLVSDGSKWSDLEKLYQAYTINVIITFCYSTTKNTLRFL